MTLNIWISSVSRRTQTFNSIRSSITMCIFATQSSGAVRFLLHTTTMIWISTGTRIAHTLRFLQRIFTVSVRATSRITDSWINRYQITKNISIKLRNLRKVELIDMLSDERLDQSLIVISSNTYVAYRGDPDFQWNKDCTRIYSSLGHKMHQPRRLCLRIDVYTFHLCTRLVLRRELLENKRPVDTDHQGTDSPWNLRYICTLVHYNSRYTVLQSHTRNHRTL